MEVDQNLKIHQARRVSPRAKKTTQSTWNSFPNRKIFFGGQPQRAARIDSWTIKFLCYQNGRNFAVPKKKLKAFLGINPIMAINELPTVAEYWRVDNLIGNDSIQNTMIRNRFCEILQNLHFADNRKDDKTDKAFKMISVMDHLNSKFYEVLSNDSEQSIDEHMVKFKGRSGMKRYIKSKPIKWGFSFWFCCWTKSGCLYQMDIYLGRKETPEFNLGLWKKSFTGWRKTWSDRFALSILITFLIV